MATRHERTGTRERIAERRVQALELRKAGAPYRAIAKALNCDVRAAHTAVMQALERLAKTEENVATQVRAIELERIDELWRAAYTRAKGGDLQAIDRAIRIMERRARLLGLDAPAKHEVGGAGGGALTVAVVDTILRDGDAEPEAS